MSYFSELLVHHRTHFGEEYRNNPDPFLRTLSHTKLSQAAMVAHLEENGYRMRSPSTFNEYEKGSKHPTRRGQNSPEDFLRIVGEAYHLNQHQYSLLVAAYVDVAGSEQVRPETAQKVEVWRRTHPNMRAEVDRALGRRTIPS